LTTLGRPGPLYPAGRFMLGLSLISPHCESHTVIHSCVLHGHRAQLLYEHVLGCIHCPGDWTLEGWDVSHVLIFMYALSTAESYVVTGRFSHLLQDNSGQRATVSHELRSIITYLFIKIDTAMTKIKLSL
jgi:hypothetical protein